MAFGVWPQSDAMTFLLSLLLVVSVLATSSAAPARPALAPVLYGPVPNYGAQPRGGLAVGRAELGGGLAGASLAGLGSRTLSQLAESELDRYAFLMLDPAASGSDSVLGTVTRRITPKSVFIAPSINGGRDQCDEGYHQDEMGRCIKVVKVDAQKSWDLLLDKLNSQFAELPAPLSVLPESTSPAASSSGAPPGAPPGPFQLTIPIADLPAAPEGERQPVSPSSELLTEAITEVVEEASTTVTPDEEEEETRASTVVPESMTALPAPAALVPEVVMLTSDEHLPAKLGSSPTAQVGAYLVNDAPARGTTAPVVPVNQSDNVDVNPIINTVNNSPLVTGETESGLSLVEEVPTKPSHLVEDPPSAQLQLLATAVAAAFGLSATTTTPTSQLYDGNSSTSTTAPSLALTESTTGTPATWSSTTESVVSLSPESEPKVEDELPSTAATPESFTVRSTSIAPSFPTKPTTTSEPLEISSSSSSSDEALSSSDENRPSSSNSLRPALGTNAASTPVRFPDLTERPTVFRTQTGNVRFPTIDVTFPSPGDANRLQVDKRIVFPKEEKQSSVWWPPLASAPSFVTNWGLEQTRNRPLQPLQHSWNRSPAESYSFWSRSPSRLKHGPNKLGSSGGASPSSVFSSSSSSSSEESSQANRRTLSHSHSYRGSSSSHRRGRDWRPGTT